MTDFKLDLLDHVAIHVKDMEQTIEWYQKVFGLKKVRLEKWGDYPIFLLSGKTGIAVFPADKERVNTGRKENIVRIDHFAFNVTNENFAKARKHLEQLEIKYVFKDHHYYHSIYIQDPDDHTVELTTLVVDEKSFYS